MITYVKKRWLVLETLESRNLFNGTTIWIDPVSGSDQNDGLSPGNALRSIARIVSQYDALKPANHIALKPGDTVTLMPGDHQFAFRYGEGGWQGLLLHGVHGTKNQPITIRGLPGARVDNRAPDGSEMSSITLLSSSHIIVEGLDVTSFGSAITVADSNNILLRDNYIHDVDGVAANNLSGVYLVGVQNVTVQNNFLADNYDRTRPGNPNNRHIVVFDGVDVFIFGNTMFNTDPNAGMAVDFKHLGGLSADKAGRYEVADNTIINAAGIAIGTAAPNSHIHHNLLIDSGSIRVADFGGTNQLANELIEYNTIVNNLDRQDGGGLTYNLNEYPGFPLGRLQWLNNLVVDNRSYDHSEKSTIVVDRYGADQFYQRVIHGGLLKSEGNTYQTRHPARFDLFAANGGKYGQLGADLTFAQWQAAGFDRTGQATTVNIDAYYRNVSATNATAGIYASHSPRLFAQLSTIDIHEAGDNSTAILRLVRSGANVTQPLQVTLAVSKVGEIEVPQQVIIPAGVDAIEVPVKGLADNRADSTEALQIRVSASGMSETTTWLRLHDSLPVNDPDGPDMPDDPNKALEGVFQIPGTAGEPVRLQSAVVQRQAAYNNEMGIAYVDDASGRVGKLRPIDPGWAQALLSRGKHQVVLGAGVRAGDVGVVELTAGRHFVFYLVQDNSTSQWLSQNPQNDLAKAPLLFTSIPASNPDRYDHVREQHRNTAVDLAWEDLTYGGDESFRDLMVRNEFSSAVPDRYQVVDDAFRQVGNGPMIFNPLANDELPKGSRIAIVTQPESGQVKIADSGDKIKYTPASHQYGLFQFSYTVEIANRTLTGQVELSVEKEWTNAILPSDVNGDGRVNALDALLVINALIQHSEMELPPYPKGTMSELAMIDVNSDQRLTFLDALIVIGSLLNQP